jgi:hypothetical protein
VPRDGVELHSFFCAERALIEGSGRRVRVEEIEAIYARCVACAVVHPNGALEPKPWGAREFTLLEPDGIIVTFCEPSAPAAT